MQLFRFNGTDRRAPGYAAVFATMNSTGSRLSVPSMTHFKETRIQSRPTSDLLLGWYADWGKVHVGQIAVFSGA